MKYLLVVLLFLGSNACATCPNNFVQVCFNNDAPVLDSYQDADIIIEWERHCYKKDGVWGSKLTEYKCDKYTVSNHKLVKKPPAPNISRVGCEQTNDNSLAKTGER